MIAAGDLTHCESMLRVGSRSFYAASRLLPRRVRDPAVALYAFCRTADDAVDEGEATIAAVDRLRARVDRAYAGRALDDAVDRAFASVVGDFAIPREVPDALLEGMAWDAEGKRYDDVDALYGYCARVASSVGVMMTLVMGPRAPHVLARACDLGVAMQMTNIARDVGEDAARGRIYLPARWLHEAGVDEEAWLARPVFDERIGSVVARALTAADVLYARADSGIALLPRDCRVAIRAARLIYSDIGRGIARAKYDSVTRRAYVSGARKLWLVVRAMIGARNAARAREPELGAVTFLLRAAASEASA